MPPLSCSVGPLQAASWSPHRWDTFCPEAIHSSWQCSAWWLSEMTVDWRSQTAKLRRANWNLMSSPPAPWFWGVDQHTRLTIHLEMHKLALSKMVEPWLIYWLPITTTSTSDDSPDQRTRNQTDPPCLMLLSILPSNLGPILWGSFSFLPPINSFFHIPTKHTRDIKRGLIWSVSNLEADNYIWGSFLNFSHQLSHIKQFWKFLHYIINNCSNFVFP